MTEQQRSLLAPEALVEFAVQKASPALPTRSPSIFRTYGIPVILFVISLVTTTAIGARFMQNFNDGLPAVAQDGDLWPWPWLIAHPDRFLLGWSFSLSLLAILLAHEFGHYLACRYHGIRATLPWVLPAPTLSGTAGAIIQLRSPIPNRKALMDVGAYGPIAGYLVALPILIVGLLLSRDPAGAEELPPSIIQFGQPMTLNLLQGFVARLHLGTPAFAHSLHHPVLIAGWVGLFITALNLIPGGQLDGGHILYALSPRIHRWTSRLLPIALLVCGFFFWIGWFLWALILLIPAMRHPQVPAGDPLDRKRLILSIAALAIFVLTCAAEPFLGGGLLHYLR